MDSPVEEGGFEPSVPLSKSPRKTARESGSVACSLVGVRFAEDSTLEEAVSSEPKRAINQSVMSQFPTHPNREFFAALQGI